MCTVCFRKSLSSTDSPGLSSFVVRSNIVSLSNSEDGIAFCSILLNDNC
jgi:hypothetical protein